MLGTGSTVRVIGQREVQLKLLAAAPRILAQNRALIGSMLDVVKPAVEGDTPIGPGHFGYHGRDTLKVRITSVGGGIQSRGQLVAAVQVYWREFGTGLRYRGPRKKQAAMRALTGQAGTGGEKAYLPATKALRAAKRFIAFYYGGMANWWRL